MRLSRRTELVAGVCVLVASIIGLALVVHYVILPDMPHTEQLSVVTYYPSEVDVFKSPTYFSDSSQYACQQKAPCCLQMELLITRAGQQQFTTRVNLPYGLATATQAELPPSSACQRAAGFAQTLGYHPVAFIATQDSNAVYFNQSTDSNCQECEFWQTWPGSDPAHPSITVTVRRGTGVTIGAGFLLTGCIVGIVLSSLLLGLRVWDDCHTVPGSSAADSVRRSDFARLEGGADDEEIAYAAANSPARAQQHDAALAPIGSLPPTASARSSRTSAKRVSFPLPSASTPSRQADTSRTTQPAAIELQPRDELHAQHDMDSSSEPHSPSDAHSEHMHPTHDAAHDSGMREALPGALSPRSPVPRLAPPPTAPLAQQQDATQPV